MDTFDWVTSIAKAVFLIVVGLQIVPIMVWVERRGSALLQNRLGPNRVGPLGLIQSLADAVKGIFKEGRAPGHVEKFYYIIAPVISVAVAFMTFAIVPFASSINIDGRELVFQVADLNVGILYLFAVGSLGVYGIIMAGWASNSKYSLFGSLRSTAQMISYELSLGLSVIGIIMVYSTIDLGEIAAMQGQAWFHLGPLAVPKLGFFVQPLGFIIFMTAAYAETNRLPFDLPEGESEIVAGYHLEYSSLGFATFMLGEYLAMATMSAVVATLFFGGWQFLPGMGLAHAGMSDLLGLSEMGREWLRVGFEVISFFLKVGFFLWVFVWVRWTLPRFRYDQLMNFGWKVMLPLSLVNVFATGLFIYLGWL